MKSILGYKKSIGVKFAKCIEFRSKYGYDSALLNEQVYMIFGMLDGLLYMSDDDVCFNSLWSIAVRLTSEDGLVPSDKSEIEKYLYIHID